MANTVSILSYANTFGDWVVTTNSLVKENNDLAANNYHKTTGTLYLDEPTLGLQVANNAVVAGQLAVQGIGSSAYVQNNMNVGSQLYLTNTTLSLVASGQANVSGPIYAKGVGTGLYVSNNAIIYGNTAISGYETVGGTLTVEGKTTINDLLEVYDVTTAHANVNALDNINVTNDVNALNFNATNEVNTFNLNVSNEAVVRYNTISNKVQANTSVNSAILTATSIVYGNTVQANNVVNSSISTTNTSYANKAYANTLIETSALSVIGDTYGDLINANTAIVTPTLVVSNTSYTNALVANTLINSATLNSETLSTSGTQYVNNVTANTNITSPRFTATSIIDANSASIFTNTLQTLGQLTVGGNFVISGSTIYNSNTFTLSAASNNQISYVNVYRNTTNASIRWNETQKYWDMLDVNDTTYYRVLHNGHLSSSINNTSTSNVATSFAVYTVNQNLVANVTSLQSQITANTASLQSQITANTTSLQSQITANTISLQSQISSNAVTSSAGISAAYGRANTSSNTFVGTSGTATATNGSITFASTNGTTVVGSGNTVTINTPQDLRTTANPTFNSLTLTTPLQPSQGGTGATSTSAALTALLPGSATAGYVLTTGGPGNYYWAPGGSGGGTVQPGTTINSTRLTYTASSNGRVTFDTPTWTTSTQLRAFINGVRQFESEYSANSSNSTITFSTAPANGDQLLIEVDGYIINPYYANNIPFTAPQGSIPSTANTIQLAVQDLESRKAALAGATFTGNVYAQTAQTANNGTEVATTAHVKNVLNDSGSTYAIGTSGNAGTATKLKTARTINGVSFDGSTNITIPSTTSSSVTFNNSGTGVASGSSFDGSTAVTVSYNSIGAPSTSGTNATGTWGISITGNSVTTSQTNFTNLTVGSSQVLYAGNYNTYAPSLTGTGASGTWGISITGNANYATTAGSATSASTATNANYASSAGSVSWSNVSGRPTALSSFTNDLSFATSSTNSWSPSGGTFAVGGAITATGNITAFYSDKRLKTEIGKIENALDKIDQLTGVIYTQNKLAESFGYNNYEEQVGLYAQDVKAVQPQAVKPAPFDIAEDGTSKSGENYLTVQYEKLIPLLVEGIKELRAEIEALKGNNK